MTTKANGPDPSCEIYEAVNVLASEVLTGDFGQFWSETDIAARHWEQLRGKLPAGGYEVHLELSVAGLGGTKRPDVSVIRRQDAWSNRSKDTRAVYAAEMKSFAYRGSGGYRIGDTEFDKLLEALREQFQQLKDRVKHGELQAGLVLWRDCFDWRGRPRLTDEKRQCVIQERADWVKQKLDRPFCGVRVEYLPCKFPQHKVSLDNGFKGALRVPED